MEKNFNIIIEKIDSENYKVTVVGSKTTVHMVEISSEYYEKLTGGHVKAEDLIEQSFIFLLERESNSSILRTFELPLIKSYFPEYEDVIRKKLAG